MYFPEGLENTPLKFILFVFLLAYNGILLLSQMAINVPPAFINGNHTVKGDRKMTWYAGRNSNGLMPYQCRS